MPQAAGRPSRIAAGCLCVLSLLVALTACGRSPEVTSEATSQAPPSATPTPSSASPSPSVTPSPSSPTVTPPVPDREPHTLVLKVVKVGSGDLAITKFKYTLDGKVEQEGGAKLPWRRSLSVPADGLPHSYELEVEHTGKGRFQMFAIYDGVVKAQTDGWGTGTGTFTGAGAIGGVVRG